MTTKNHNMKFLSCCGCYWCCVAVQMKCFVTFFLLSTWRTTTRTATAFFFYIFIRLTTTVIIARSHSTLIEHKQTGQTTQSEWSQKIFLLDFYTSIIINSQVNIFAIIIKQMIYVFALVYATVLLITILLPHYFVSELALSFLPYHSVFLFLLTLVLCLRFKNKQWWAKLLCIVFLVIMSLHTTLQQTQFYKNEELSSQENFDKTQEEIGLKVLFANILKFNTNYDDLIATIKEHHPDVVMFVEYKQHHHDNLEMFFSKEYPYVNRIKGEQDVVGNVIFSKIPLEDFAPKIYQWARRYGYVAITHEQQDYYFYLVHTSAPVSEELYDNRNKQIALFQSNLIEHEQRRLPEDKVIIVGDFNVSPRTPMFKQFNEQLQKLPNPMTHIAQYMPPYTTRWLQRWGEHYLGFTQSFIRSHIDHIWFSNNTTLYQAQIIPIEWSDHNGIVVRVY